MAKRNIREFLFATSSRRAKNKMNGRNTLRFEPMDVTETKITVRELTQDYWEKEERGVFGYSGRLNIRPPYQRQFVYKDEQQAAVIKTICGGGLANKKGYPLNLMYWAVLGKDAEYEYEIIDGQQRTISICRYVDGGFVVGGLFGRGDKEEMSFYNLPNDQQDRILDYELTVYQCKGTDSEKLDWFETINIPGEELSKQELRSAIFSGRWASSARRDFCNGGNSSAAHRLGGKYLAKGKGIDRQFYLETVLKWISGSNTDEAIRKYMGKHQRKRDAEELWDYFKAVIRWVQVVFPEYNALMKGLPWGDIHREFKGKKSAVDAPALQAEIDKLLLDDDVQKKKGIWQYVLDGKETHLNLRLFDDEQKATAHAKQKGICRNPYSKCKTPSEKLDIKEMQADHIKPWSEGGKTELGNCQMLCKECHDDKTKRQMAGRRGNK